MLLTARHGDIDKFKLSYLMILTLTVTLCRGMGRMRWAAAVLVRLGQVREKTRYQPGLSHLAQWYIKQFPPRNKVNKSYLKRRDIVLN